MKSKKLASGCIVAVLLGLLSQVTLAQSPVQNELTKLLASDGAVTDKFGYSIEVDGDTAVIGAPENDDYGYNSGTAYIFVRDSSGTWTEQAKIYGNDTDRGNRFGESVGVDGDTIVIGSRMKLTALGRSGVAYIFTRDQHGTWNQSDRLLPSDGMTGDQFGSAVAIDGDTIIVGSQYDTERPGVYPPGSGSAYVFERDQAGAWIEQAKLRASDTDDLWLFKFGGSVDVDGDLAVVGADGFDSQAGAAYIFARDATGNWAEQAKLLDPEAEPDALFGAAVCVDDETVLIGAPLKGDWSGAVYAFSRDGDGAWVSHVKLTAADSAADDLFGGAIDLAGNTAVVGANGQDDNGRRAGAVYGFRRSGENWSEFVKLLASDGDWYDQLGDAVSISQGTLIAGASRDEELGLSSGSAYVFGLAAAVDIDIRPNNRHNLVVPWSRGLVPVAVLGSADFDALQIDPATVEFGPAGAPPFRRSTRARDVNRDGYTDLVMMFRARDAGLDRGDTEASLAGLTYDSQAFAGTDSIITPP